MVIHKKILIFFFLSCPKYGIRKEILLHTVHNLMIPVFVEISQHGCNQCNLTINSQIKTKIENFITIV